MQRSEQSCNLACRLLHKKRYQIAQVFHAEVFLQPCGHDRRLDRLAMSYLAALELKEIPACVGVGFDSVVAPLGEPLADVRLAVVSHKEPRFKVGRHFAAGVEN